MATPHTTRLGFQPGGWVSYASVNTPHSVSVHVSKTPAGRWVIDMIKLAAGGTGTGEYPTGRITARDLQRLPLGQLEATLNHLAQQGLAPLLEVEGQRQVKMRHPELDTEIVVAGTARDLLPGPPKAPAKGAKGDEFYRQIGAIYGKAAMNSTRPAADLAEVWKMPITTIHRWIREARRRGHLPPAEQGRRG